MNTKVWLKTSERLLLLTSSKRWSPPRTCRPHWARSARLYCGSSSDSWCPWPPPAQPGCREEKHELCVFNRRNEQRKPAYLLLLGFHSGWQMSHIIIAHRSRTHRILERKSSTRQQQKLWMQLVIFNNYQSMTKSVMTFVLHWKFQTCLWMSNFLVQNTTQGKIRMIFFIRK